METYTVKQVAKILQTGYRTILNEIIEGNLNAFKIGRQYRVTEDQLNNYIQNSKYAAYYPKGSSQ